MSFMNIAMAKFNIEFSVTQCRSIGAWTPKSCGSIPSGEVHFSFFPTLFAKKKNGIFQCFESNIGFLFPPFAYNFRHQLR